MSEHKSTIGRPKDVRENVRNAHKNKETAKRNKIKAHENRTEAYKNKTESNNERKISTIKEMRVINDPYRKEIMFTLLNLQKPATSKEVAGILGEAPSKINYHMGILHDHDFVILDHTESINGIIAKYYKVEVSSITADMESYESEFRDEKVFKEFIKTQFDSARDKFLTESLIRISEGIQDENELGPIVSTNKIYLTQQQKEQYEKLLSEVLNYKGEKRDDSKPYSIFISYIEESDKNQNNK